MIQISRMASSVKPSATLAAGALAKEMKAKGVDVYDFSMGEPDFNTPDHICQAAYDAMKAGHTHYTPAAGLMEVRKTIADWYRKTYGLAAEPQHVIVSNGAKHSIHTALAATLNPGDEVIIPTPYWVSYSDLVEMTGASYKLVETSIDNQFKMSPEQLRAAITPKSKLFMLNSPSNPTGSVYTRSELEAIADIVMEHKLAVMSDEIYERLIYGDAKATCFATLRDGLFDQTITISGVSKTYAMTGWRMGWAVAPPSVVKAMSTIQSQQTSSPSSISQYATIAALTGDQTCVDEMRKQFAKRRDLVCQRLNDIPGVKCPVPGGAFYAFFDVSSFYGKTLAGVKVTDSLSFATVALEKAHVNVVAGVAFGADSCVRMSFAASEADLNGGLDRLRDLLTAT